MSDPFALAAFLLSAAGREPKDTPTVPSPAPALPADEVVPPEPPADREGFAAAGLLSLQGAIDTNPLESVPVKDELHLTEDPALVPDPASGERNDLGTDLETDKTLQKVRKGRPTSPLLACCLKCKLNHRTVAHCRLQQIHSAPNWCDPQPKKAKPEPTPPKPMMPAQQRPRGNLRRPTAIDVPEDHSQTEGVDSGRPDTSSSGRRSAKRAREAVAEQVRAEETLNSPARYPGKSPKEAKTGGEFPCAHCGRVFPSHAAMSGHKRSPIIPYPTPYSQ